MSYVYDKDDDALRACHQEIRRLRNVVRVLEEENQEYKQGIERLAKENRALNGIKEKIARGVNFLEFERFAIEELKVFLDVIREYAQDGAT